MTYSFNIVFRPEPEGGYTVLVPSLPGCLTWAETIPEGKKLIQESIYAYIESVRKHNDNEWQDDSESFISSVNVEYA